MKACPTQRIEWFYCFSSILESVSEVGHMCMGGMGVGLANQNGHLLLLASYHAVPQCFFSFLRGLSGIPFLLDKALPG